MVVGAMHPTAIADVWLVRLGPTFKKSSGCRAFDALTLIASMVVGVIIPTSIGGASTSFFPQLCSFLSILVSLTLKFLARGSA